MDNIRERFSYRNTANIFVGRETELIKLVDRYNEAIDTLQEEGIEQFIPIYLTSIKGTEGIGKSTLFRLMIDYLKKDCPEMFFLSGYANKENASSLSLWRSLVTNLIGQFVKSETSSVIESVDALFEFLHSGNFGDDEYWRLANGNRIGLECLLGVYNSEDQRNLFYEIMIALTTLIQTAALKYNREHSKPLVLYLDDCQWADEQSMIMFESVMVALNSVNRKLTNNRISLFIVMTCRPEFKLPARVAGNSNFNELELEYLPDEAIKDFIVKLSDEISLSPETQYDLLTSGKGNPLYITEWLNLHCEQKSSSINLQGNISIAGSMQQDSHLSLNNIIISRLNLQTNYAQKILKILSLCGSDVSNHFLFTVTAKMMEIDLSKFEETTEELCLFGWLIKNAGRNETLLTFSNKQNLEVCADIINRQDRQMMHLAIAEIAEDIYGKETDKAEYIANHYEQAGMNDKALIYYLRADQSNNLKSYSSQKMNLYEKILILYNQKSNLSHDEAANVIMYRIRRAACLKNYDREIDELQEILESAQDESFAELQVDIHLRLANLMREKRDFEQALSILIDASKIAFSHSLKKSSTLVLLSIAHVYSDQNKLTKAMEYYKELESDIASLDLVEQENLYQGISAIHLYSGHLADAEHYIRKAISIFNDGSKHESKANLYNILGLINYYKGAIADAEICWKKSLELAEYFGMEDMIFQALGNIALIKHGNEDYDAALQIFKRIQEFGIRQKMHDYTANTYASIGDVLMKKGEYTQAWENFRCQLQLATEHNLKRQQFLAYLNFSQLSMLKNNLLTCADFLSKAEELSDKYSANHFSDILLLKAELAFKNKEYSIALEFLSQTKKAASEYSRDDVLLETEIISLYLAKEMCRPHELNGEISKYGDFVKNLKSKGDRVRMRHAIAHCILDVNLQLAITIFKEIAADADYLYQYSGRKIYQDIAIESKKYL